MSRADQLAKRSKKKSATQPAFAAPREKRKTLSVDLPTDRHRALKTACAQHDIPIRNVLLAVIDEIEAGSDIGQALLDAAQPND